MSAVNRLTLDSLVNQFQVNHLTHFTGHLDIQADNKHGWRLYFHMGRLAWTTGGVHRFRQWRRCMSQFCPQVDLNNIPLHKVGDAETWEYLILTALTKQGRVTREQAVAVIQSTLTELLFDILQALELEQLTHTIIPQNGLDSPLTAINPEQILLQTQQVFKVWRDAGLTHQSPNLAPVVKQPDELRQQMPPQTYQKIVTSINGNLTLRELATQMRLDALVLTRSLMPYIHRGWIGLVEVKDLPNPAYPSKAANQPAAQPTGPVVVCIDDSVEICRRLGEILTQAGYRFVSVQESVRALQTLLENKPSLIFLDVVMPVANGYEICAQIRKMSAFKQTPVVILTGNDGIIDRVRAKAAGASDFLAKPIKADQVLAVVQKHLNIVAAASATPD
ncbi:MAG TPA: response regulator [Cyanobacteria bacterium UBA11049]|nr:response regulator [Cyanobacteria bacterium UBA11049]